MTVQRLFRAAKKARAFGTDTDDAVAVALHRLDISASSLDAEALCRSVIDASLDDVKYLDNHGQLSTEDAVEIILMLSRSEPHIQGDCAVSAAAEWVREMGPWPSHIGSWIRAGVWDPKMVPDGRTPCELIGWSGDGSEPVWIDSPFLAKEEGCDVECWDGRAAKLGIAVSAACTAIQDEGAELCGEGIGAVIGVALLALGVPAETPSDPLDDDDIQDISDTWLKARGVPQRAMPSLRDLGVSYDVAKAHGRDPVGALVKRLERCIRDEARPTGRHATEEEMNVMACALRAVRTIAAEARRAA